MTPVLPNYKHYTQNLIVMTSADAKRLWRKDIKEANNYECIYCGQNCVPACRRCNQQKGSNNWLTWFRDNFPPNPFRENLILNWIK